MDGFIFDEYMFYTTDKFENFTQAKTSCSQTGSFIANVSQLNMEDFFNTLVEDQGSKLKNYLYLRVHPFTKSIKDCYGLLKLLNSDFNTGSNSNIIDICKGEPDFLTETFNTLCSQKYHSKSNLSSNADDVKTPLNIIIIVSAILVIIIALSAAFFIKRRRNLRKRTNEGNERLGMRKWDFRPDLRDESNNAKIGHNKNESDPSIYTSKFHDRFSVDKILGSGSDGIVFQVTHRILNLQQSAVKRVVRHNSELHDINDESQILQRMEHENICKILDCWNEEPPYKWQTKKDREFFNLPNKKNRKNILRNYHLLTKTDTRMKRYIVESSGESEGSVENENNQFQLNAETIAHIAYQNRRHTKTSVYRFYQIELCSEDTLQTYLEEHNCWGTRDFDDIICFINQIVAAVQYIHSRGIVHRDIKPSNILFSKSNPKQIKVADFGISRRKTTKKKNFLLSHQAGTPLYAAPEITRKVKSGTTYDERIDVYSLGLVMLEMISPRSDFKKVKKLLEDAKMKKFPRAYLTNIPEMVTFVKACTDVDSSKRPTSDQIAKMDFRKILKNKNCLTEN